MPQSCQKVVKSYLMRMSLVDVVDNDQSNVRQNGLDWMICGI